MGASPPQVVGRYAIYSKIAQGGMASVHFGRLQGSAGFSRTVAIKRLHPHLAEEPDFLATMIDEARMAARIHHPNVVPTLDVVTEAGELLVVMEYVRGESLSKLIRGEAVRKRRIPLPVASAIMIGALNGLHAAHEATSDHGTPLGIVHRDVSPQNILVGVDGVARIIDFGVAKAAGRIQTTSTGVIKGKIAYMPPEQLGGQEATRLVNVYAMGVVFWEMLCGRVLFKADSDAALVVQVLGGAKGPPSQFTPNLPAALDALVMKAMSHEPSARFSSAIEMADALSRIVPPAQPREVGVWVDELARESLVQRASALAEIESVSGMSTVRPPTSGSWVPIPAIPLVTSEQTVADGIAVRALRQEASQPSSLSVETAKSAIVQGQRRRPAVVAGAVALLALATGTIVWVSRAKESERVERPSVAATTASASTPPMPVPPPPSAVPPSASAVQAASSIAAAVPEVVPEMLPVARPVPIAPPSRPASPAAPPKPRPAPAPQPSAMVRFAQPD